MGWGSLKGRGKVAKRIDVVARFGKGGWDVPLFGSSINHQVHSPKRVAHNAKEAPPRLWHNSRKGEIWGRVERGAGLPRRGSGKKNNLQTASQNLRRALQGRSSFTG